MKFLNPWSEHLRNISFSEDFVCVLNIWHLTLVWKKSLFRYVTAMYHDKDNWTETKSKIGWRHKSCCQWSRTSETNLQSTNLGSLLNGVKNVKCEDLIDSAVIKQRFHSPVNGMFTVYPGSFDLLNVNNRKSRSTRKMLSKALTPVWHLYGHVWVRAAHMQSNGAAVVIPVASCGRLREINVGCSCD